MKRYIFVLALSLIATSASGQHVWLNGTPYPDIQSAIDAAVDGQTVVLDDNWTFTGLNNRDIDYRNKAITVRSQSGIPDGCIIDCGGSAATPHRGFYFHSGEGSGSVLEGVTIKNGYIVSQDGGGGILCGGFSSPASSPTIKDCVFANNVAQQSGGGMACILSSPTLDNCTFLNNTALGGGGIAYIFFCPVGARSTQDGSGIDGWPFSAHSAEYDVGGVWPVLRDCTFISNISTASGGAVMCVCSPLLEVIDCYFYDNSATTDGGAISYYEPSLELSGSTFSNNSASRGGGMYCSTVWWFDIAVENCTFYESSAPTGGGMWFGSTWNPKNDMVATLDNTIISSSIGGEAIFCDQTNTYTADVTLTCCDIFDNDGGNYIGCIAGQDTLSGNISLDPLFCDPEFEDFTLHSDSPCAPFSPPNAQCDLIGAWPVGCEPASVDEQEVLPTAMHLVPIAPNPFRPSTHITYMIPAGSDASPVLLRIHDLAGRVVRTLIDTRQAAGIYTATWDGTNESGAPVAGGVYFCQLKLNGEMQTRRMILVK